MQEEAKITSKGQITLPYQIRRLLGVKEGDRVVFESDEEGVRVRPVRRPSPFARYRGIGNPGLGSGRKAVIGYVRRLRGR